jgi:hypothetical protein
MNDVEKQQHVARLGSLLDTVNKLVDSIESMISESAPHTDISSFYLIQERRLLHVRDDLIWKLDELKE